VRYLLSQLPAYQRAAAPSPQPELSGTIGNLPNIRKMLTEFAAQWYDHPGEEIKRLALFAVIDAWKDAACAVAFEDGKRLAHEQACRVTHALMAERDSYRQRATDAEAKLAAIREGKNIRVKYADYFATIERAQECLRQIAEFKLSESSAQRTATPSQGDTSCIKDCRTGTQTVRELAATMIEMKQKESELTWVSKGHRINLYVKILRNMPQESDTSGLPG
jgi:hypothetical protein